jgi:hypothetical protein
MAVDPLPPAACRRIVRLLGAPVRVALGTDYEGALIRPYGAPSVDEVAV